MSTEEQRRKWREYKDAKRKEPWEIPVFATHYRITTISTPVTLLNDAHVIITRPDCVPQGLRLGDWSQVESGKSA